ncbi:oligosaccharide flippase family protein [Empedobacter stercoris]|uniref:oligosaccharide flippase family protein n=1 Tax=Empedobacter stercoris TaxID=1628248 RepID=UPI001CE05F1C|nr:oligosaccharide flippase family protein [Empedobacter stercoris]MCA4776700.1 oligosaccharide flippase family protein [Empedobacter stercoris]
MLKKLLNNKDKKTLFENFISLSTLQIVGMILPLITLPYVLRIIGFEKYGIITMSTVLINYFQSFTDFSFKVTATRDIATHRHSQKMINIIYSKLIVIKSMFFILSIVSILLIVLLYPPFYENRLIYIITAFSLLGYAIFPEWFFQGIEKMKFITYLNISIKLFFTLSVFLFIKEENDFWIYPLSQTLGLIFAGAIGQYIMIRKYNVRFVRVKTKSIIENIKSNIPIFINQFLPNLYNNTSTFILGIFQSSYMVGIYQSILIMINLSMSLIEIFSRVFFPYLTRKKNSFEKFKKMMITLVSIGILIIILSNKLIFWYLDIKYENAFIVLLILAIGLLGYTFSRVFGLNYFIVHRKDKLVMNNTIVASIIGFILAFPLIYYLGIIGAAINLSLSRWIMGGGLFYKYLKYEK